MTRLIPFTENEYFHIYNRGVNKMLIFNHDLDYKRFTELLYIVNSEETLKYSDISKNNIWDIEQGNTLVDIGAWVLMPNHFHIMIKSKNPNKTSLFLKRLQSSHSKYFNTKYDRTGVLFQGKSKAKSLNNDNYLKYNFSYIHLNPLKLLENRWKEEGLKDFNRAIEFLKKYKYSSLPDFLGQERKENKIVKKEEFPEYFLNEQDYLKELLEWMDYEEKDK